MGKDNSPKLCPYCGRPLGEKDNVIYCSKCGVPYHAACWYANKGCKYHDGYGRPYGNPAAPSYSPQSDYASYCPDCGAMVSAAAQNCMQCGSYIAGRIRKAPRTETYQAAARDSYSDHYRLEESYIGTNQDCYLKKFRGIRTNSTVVSWNWCAFLFPPFWFCTVSCTNGRHCLDWFPSACPLFCCRRSFCSLDLQALSWPGFLPTLSISSRLKRGRKLAERCRKTFDLCMWPNTEASTLRLSL